MKKICIISFLITFLMQELYAQQTIHLYDGKVPNSKPYTTKELWEPQDNGDTLVHYTSEPTLAVFLPEKSKANGTAVIICPGGGYWVTSIVKEGFSVARKFNEMGVTAFVLKYRIPNDSSMIDRKIGPLQDAQRAIQLVRMRANEWNVDPNKVGIMGFSAGGHVASTEATHFNKALIENKNNTNLRPDFQILIYPVISMHDSLTHKDSRTQLLGSDPTKENVDLYSNELQVNKDSPPAYITQAADDKVVDVDNSIIYFEKLRHNNVPVEMHIYEKGNHGFVFKHPGWMDPLFEWMQSHNWMNK